jgi:hypothetical protein
VKIAPSERAGVTGKRPFKSGWSSFFWPFREIFEQRFDLSFREVFEMQVYSWWDTRTQVLFSEVYIMQIYLVSVIEQEMQYYDGFWNAPPTGWVH